MVIPNFNKSNIQCNEPISRIPGCKIKYKQINLVDPANYWTIIFPGLFL